MSGSQAKIKKIPYGISDYEKIVTGNYYYVDKTPYLKTLEDAGDYLFFIRPRRFGKSLFLATPQGGRKVARLTEGPAAGTLRRLVPRGSAGLRQTWMRAV